MIMFRVDQNFRAYIKNQYSKRKHGKTYEARLKIKLRDELRAREE